MKHGVGPGGVHLYPAFPYASYQHMTYEDLIDLKAYLDTLPAVKHKAEPHQLTFPYNIRRAVGLWQLLYVDGKTFEPDAKASAEINRGDYLVNGPGHCGECHSPRNFLGGIIKSQAFAGARNPEGKGRSRTSRRAMTGLPIGARRTSPICSKPATRLISTWSAASWRGCRRTWRSSSRKTVRRLPPI